MLMSSLLLITALHTPAVSLDKAIEVPLEPSPDVSAIAYNSSPSTSAKACSKGNYCRGTGRRALA